jgi:hypothetical protein
MDVRKVRRTHYSSGEGVPPLSYWCTPEFRERVKVAAIASVAAKHGETAVHNEYLEYGRGLLLLNV